MTNLPFRVDVAPMTPLPLTRSPLFSYRSAEAIPIGSLVEISFGKQLLRGIVFTCEPFPGKPAHWIKPISRVLRRSWLTPQQLELAQSVSSLFFSSLGNTLKHFVFPTGKKSAGFPELTQQLRPKRVRQSKGNERSLSLTKESKLIKTVLQAATKAQKNGKAMLILVPDLLSGALWKDRLTTEFGDSLVESLTSQLSPKKLETLWGDLRSQKALIVVGTRQALFAPWTNLEAILFLHPEEALAYKQWDMTPYYTAEAMASVLAQLSHCQLMRLSTSPALNLTTAHSKKSSRNITVTPRIIDRRLEGQGARAKALGPELIKAIEVLPEKAKILLLAKERGVSGVMLCLRCKATARCPQCEHVLGENKDGVLRCFHCQYKSSLFPACRVCGHQSFRGFGAGTIRVERELDRHFSKRRLLRIDRDELKSVSGFRSAVSALKQGRYDIVIATQTIGPLLPIADWALIGLVEADHALAFPGYDQEESVLRLVERSQAKLASNGECLIQTFAPDERVWQLLSHNQTQALRLELATERERFGYPPYLAIIKVIPGALTKNRGTTPEADAKMVHQRFLSLVTKESALVVTPLFRLTQAKHRGREAFLLKYPAGKAWPESVLQLLRSISAQSIIDVSPLTLL